MGRLRLGWAPSSRGVGPSDWRRHQPAAATIAALSVHMARRGEEAVEAVLHAGVEEPLPQHRVGRNATAQRQPLRADVAGGPPGLGHEHVHHRVLERGGDVGRGDVGVLAHVVDDRRLQPAEGEVVAVVEHRPRERDRVRRRPSSPPGRWPARPGSRGRGSGRPCRTPRRRRRRGWSPAAGTGRGPPCARAACGRPTRAAPRAAARAAGLRGSRRRRGPRGGSRRRTARPTRGPGPSPRSRPRAASRPAPGRSWPRPRRCRRRRRPPR